jgi:UPF0755 protein
MTIRGGGRPRDPRLQAHAFDPEDLAFDGATAQDRRRRSVRDRRARGNGNGNGHGGGLGGIVRFLVFALVLGGLVLAVLLTALRPLVSEAVVGGAYDNPGALRLPFVTDMVRERLGAALTQPPSTNDDDVTFTVRDGDTIEAVASRLAEQGFVRDPRAFVFEATVEGLAPRLAAGDFRLSRNMTPDQLVRGLEENRIEIVVVRKTFRESLRIDQMATLIQTWPEDLAIDAAEFRTIATKPPAELLADYSWLQAGGLPEGASLEGYLFPATYDLLPEATAEELIRMMLDRFVAEVGSEQASDPTFHERLTLASIVEREAKDEAERPLIAGTYQNRLNGKGAVQILNADPTVFYALDTVALRDLPFEQWTQFKFWDPPGASLADVQLPPELEAYNTYRNRGLPPGPICSPGATSIQAALAPDTEDGYFYFVAIPDDPARRHDFSKTKAEHDRKLREYGYR